MDPNSHECEYFKCPVCFEIPEDKIFRCQNGHTLCGQCSTTIKSCPRCQVSLATIKFRNRSLETLLDKLKFVCSNKELGCPEQLGRKDIKLHLIECTYSGKRIDFCKKIGFYHCNFSTNLMDLNAAIHHYRTAHNITVYSDKTLSVVLANFDKAALLKRNTKFLSSKWSPIIIDVNPGEGDGASSNGNSAGRINSNVKVMLLSSIHGKDRSASWMCVCLSPEPEAAQQFHTEFHIKSLSSQVPDLSWRTPTMDATQIDQLIHLAPFRVPVPLLLNNYVSKTNGVSNLTINVKVIKMNGKPKQGAQMADPILIFNDEAERVPTVASSTAARPGPRQNIPRTPMQIYGRSGIILDHGHSNQCNCLQCIQSRWC